MTITVPGAYGRTKFVSNLDEYCPYAINPYPPGAIDTCEIGWPLSIASPGLKRDVAKWHKIDVPLTSVIGPFVMRADPKRSKLPTLHCKASIFEAAMPPNVFPCSGSCRTRGYSSMPSAEHVKHKGGLRY